jgi:hypothetical protein
MNERLFLGAYWSSRKETRLECAERIIAFLDSIRAHPGLGQWFFEACKREAVVVPLDLSVETI